METIKELLGRKLKDAENRLSVAYHNKNAALLEADLKIEAEKAKIEQLKDLLGLAWDVYARNELANK